MPKERKIISVSADMFRELEKWKAELFPLGTSWNDFLQTVLVQHGNREIGKKAARSARRGRPRKNPLPEPTTEQTTEDRLGISSDSEDDFEEEYIEEEYSEEEEETEKPQSFDGMAASKSEVDSWEKNQITIDPLVETLDFISLKGGQGATLEEIVAWLTQHGFTETRILRCVDELHHKDQIVEFSELDDDGNLIYKYSKQ